jgi:hypothetical protein
VATELAFLFEAARDAAPAADYFLLASQNASGVYANQEAVVLACRALANAEKLQTDQRAARVLTIALHRAHLYVTLSRFEEAIADFGLADKVAGETKNVEAQINALCAMAMPLLTSGGISRRRNIAIALWNWLVEPNPVRGSPPRNWFSQACEGANDVYHRTGGAVFEDLSKANKQVRGSPPAHTGQTGVVLELWMLNDEGAARGWYCPRLVESHHGKPRCFSR